MLDRYWFGDVSRISPGSAGAGGQGRAQRRAPGGAANVARNAAALGVQVSLLAGWR
jgi:bifunctional ADP-heptose synthase (sugar kinase/adenylyltransferase)